MMAFESITECVSNAHAGRGSRFVAITSIQSTHAHIETRFKIRGAVKATVCVRAHTQERVTPAYRYQEVY